MVTLADYPYDINDPLEVKQAWVDAENLRLLELSYTHEQIDALTVAPVHTLLADVLLLPLTFDAEGNPLTFETEEERVARHAAIVAQELADYKAKLHASLTFREEQEALRLLNEKKSLQRSRIDSHFLSDGGAPWRTGIFDESNPLKQMNDMLGTNELTIKLDQLDAAKVQWDAEQAIIAQEKQILDVGRIVESRCIKALHYVTGMNVAASKTVEQIDAMELEFAPILVALKNHRPDKASSLIAQVVNPEYDVMKAKLLAILAGG